MNIVFAVASLTAFLTFATHTFVGGRAVARPLLADTQLPVAAKWLNYYCWHITTVLLIFFTIGFAAAALDPGQRSLALFLTPLAAALAALSAFIARKGGIPPLRLPSTSLFTLVAVFGGAGLAL